MDTYSREFLQGEVKRVKNLAITRLVNDLSQNILERARLTYAQKYTIELTKIQQRIPQNESKPTIEEIVEGFRLKFPGCKVELEEIWEPCLLNHNQMNKKAGITVDWS